MLDRARQLQIAGDVSALGKMIASSSGGVKGELLAMLAFELAFQGKSRTVVMRLMRMSFAQTVDDVKSLHRKHYQRHLLEAMLNKDPQILRDYAELKSLGKESST